MAGYEQEFACAVALAVVGAGEAKQPRNYDQTRSLVNDSTRNLGAAAVIVEIGWTF
jgi:hypothetical protein